MFHGWKVVAGAFLVALFGWGLGFYGIGVFLATLRTQHGWSAALVSSAVTAYYMLGATLIAFVGLAFERWGARRVVLAGATAMAGAAFWLTRLTAVWELYAGFALLAVGWACMSGAALNLIVAPWFDRKRGMAISFAFNGASFGGILVVPLLILLIERWGFSTGVGLVCLVMGLILVPVALRWFHRNPAAIGLGPDGDAAEPAAAVPSQPSTRQRHWRSLASWHFVSVSLPFALGLMAQVGFLTHQVAFLTPLLGTFGAGWAVSLTTVAAVLGRLIVGGFVDRVNRRVVVAGNCLLQVAALALLVFATGPALLFVGCALFGLSVGNMTSLPSLIVQVEFPKPDFARIVGTVIAANQFTYALGPSLVGWLRDLTGSYQAALVACMALLLVACAVVLAGAARRATGALAAPR